jgi:hypothetical protein
VAKAAGSDGAFQLLAGFGVLALLCFPGFDL